MQEDKKLKDLLQKWAVENPSVDFTSQVMQRVTSAYTFNANTPSLFKQRLLKLMLGAFILVSIALLALGFTMPAIAFPFQLTITFPAKYFSQSFQFIIIFWIVMLFNIMFKKYTPTIR